MAQELRKNYISLQEATEYCPYSQPYLRLRVRQGKLQAVKEGRNWVTTKEWIEEYVKRVEEYNNKTKKILPLPPDNLPVEPIAEPTPIPFIFPVRKLGFLAVLVFLLLFVGTTFSKENLAKVRRDFALVALTIKQSVQDVSSEDILKSAKEIPTYVPYLTDQQVLTYTLTTYKEYFQWLSRGVKDQGTVIAYVAKETIQDAPAAVIGSLTNLVRNAKDTFSRGLQTIGNIISKGIAKLKEIPKLVRQQPKKEGLVVIPSTGKDEEVVKKIKESFSDEVKVEPKDKTSGIIIPVFREREGEKYLYMLVPIKN